MQGTLNKKQKLIALKKKVLPMESDKESPFLLLRPISSLISKLILNKTTTTILICLLLLINIYKL